MRNTISKEGFAALSILLKAAGTDFEAFHKFLEDYELGLEIWDIRPWLEEKERFALDTFIRGFFVGKENRRVPAFLLKLFVIEETPEVKVARDDLKKMSCVTSIEDVFDFLHKYMLCGEKFDELNSWDSLLENIKVELTRIIFISKNKEEADKYFTYWGILGAFYESETIFNLAAVLAGWETKVKMREVIALATEYKRKFFVLNGLEFDEKTEMGYFLDLFK